MTRSFAAQKGAYIMKEAKQIQAALVSVLAPVKNRSQQTIDAFCRHTPAPRMGQQRRDSLPSGVKPAVTQAKIGSIKRLLPNLLSIFFFGQREVTPFFIGFALPDTAQGSNCFRAVLGGQNCQPEESSA